MRRLSLLGQSSHFLRFNRRTYTMPDSIYSLFSSTHKASYGANSNHAKGDTGSSTHGEQKSELKGPEALSVVLIGPDKPLRETLALAFGAYPLMNVRKISAYPSS